MMRNRGPVQYRGVAAVLLLAAVVACCGYAGSVAAASKHEETSRSTIEIKGETSLVILGTKGNIVVTGEEGRKEIFLEVVKCVKAESKEEARRFISEMKIVVVRDGGEIRIKTEYPKSSRSGKNIFSYILGRGPMMRMDMKLQVPQGLELSVNTASGDISASRMTGPVDMNAASGDIEASHVGNTLKISVASGDIDVVNVEGKASLYSASGDITARRIAGDADVRTSSGDVDLMELGVNLNLITASGDVIVDGVGNVTYSGTSGSARFLDVKGGVDASASSGDLSFRLLPSGEVDYIVRTSSGEIKLSFLTEMCGGYVLKAGTTTGEMSINLPIKVSKVGRHYVAGQVREGKSKVLLETSSGDITITEPGE